MRSAAVAIALVSAVVSGLTASAAVSTGPEVVVRVHQAAAGAAGDLFTPLSVARAALSDASIEVVWRTCPGEAPACRTVLAPTELSVRLIRSAAAPTSARVQPLGEAFVNTASGRGVLASVFLDRVDWLARTSGTDRNALLGRAIAHEIGHLLLGSTRHSSDGLMRALWSPGELRRAQPRDWAQPRGHRRPAGGAAWIVAGGLREVARPTGRALRHYFAPAARSSARAALRMLRIA